MLIFLLGVLALCPNEPPPPSIIEIKFTILASNLEDLKQIDFDVELFRKRAKRYPDKSKYHENLIDKSLTLRQDLLERIKRNSKGVIDWVLLQLSPYLRKMPLLLIRMKY